MATLFDINSKNVYYNVDIPNDTTNMLVNPDLTPVAGLDAMFWAVNTDNTLRSMTTAEIDAVYLASSISNQCDAVTAYRDIIMYGGFIYNTVPYDSDAQSIANICGTQLFIASGGTLPSNFVWRASDNSYQAYNNSTFSGFYFGSVDWLLTVYSVSWTHKANIAALTHYADVMSYDYKTGWPTGFSSSSGLTY